MFTFVLAWVLAFIVEELGPSGVMHLKKILNILFVSIWEICLVAYIEKLALKKYSYFLKADHNHTGFTQAPVKHSLRGTSLQNLHLGIVYKYKCILFWDRQSGNVIISSFF